MAIYYADGFEHGVVTSDGNIAAQYGSVTGAVQWDSTPVYGSTSTGSAGFDGISRYLRWDQLDIAVPTSTQAAIVIQFKLYITSMSLTNELQLMKIWTGSPFYENWLYFTAAGNIASKYWGSPPTDDSGTNSFTPSTGTWYTVDAMVSTTSASGTWTFDWQIGPTGGSKTPMTARTVTNSGGEIGTVVLGWVDAVGGNTASFNIDDLIFSNDAADFPLADNYTVGRLRPNAVGTHSIDVGSGASNYFFTNSGAISLPDSTSYQAIDDTTALLSGSDYVELRRRATSGTDTNVPPRAVDALQVTNLNETAATARGNVDEDPDSPDALWATATGNNVATAIRLDMPTLVVDSTGTMVTKAYVRKSASSGSGTPTARIDLYYNGSLVASGTNQNVTSTTGQTITQNFDLATVGPSLGDGTLIELLLAGTASGGGPSVRASVDFGAIEISSCPTLTYTQPTNTWYLEYGFADNASSDTIIGVKPVFSFVQPTSGTGDITVKLRADGVDSNIFTGNPASTSQTDRAKWYSQTPNSTSWTDARLDAATLRFGYSADADPVTRLHAALLEVLYQSSGSQSVSMTGLGSASSFGTVSYTTGNVNVSQTGLASASSLGAVNAVPMPVYVPMTGLGSQSSFGTVSTRANYNLAMTGLGSAQAFGTVQPLSNQTTTMTGLASAQTFGTLTAAPGNVGVAQTGLASASSFGTASAVAGNVNVAQTGLASASSFGSVTTVAGNVNVSQTGLGTAQAFGTVTASTASSPQTVDFTGLALGTAGALGTASAVPGGVSATMTGIGSQSSFGSVTAAPGNVTATCSALASASAFGTVSTATGNVNVAMTGLASASAFGSAVAVGAGTANPASLGSASAFGSVSTLVGNVNVAMAGLGSASAFGSITMPGGDWDVAVLGGSTRR